MTNTELWRKISNCNQLDMVITMLRRMTPDGTDRERHLTILDSLEEWHDELVADIKLGEIESKTRAE